jgi:hypothetical protein
MNKEIIKQKLEERGHSNPQKGIKNVVFSDYNRLVKILRTIHEDITSGYDDDPRTVRRNKEVIGLLENISHDASWNVDVTGDVNEILTKYRDLIDPSDARELDRLTKQFSKGLLE